MKNVSLYLARAQIRNYPLRECDHPFCKHVICDRHSIFFTCDLAKIFVHIPYLLD